jgi:hypothetical protein
MSDIHIRKAQADDLSKMQKIARRTIDESFRSFLGDKGVDWFINNSESDSELQKYIENCNVFLKANAITGWKKCNTLQSKDLHIQNY